jgi:small GTP-binding protein
MQSSGRHRLTFKYIVVGESGVGKSCLIHRFIHGEWLGGDDDSTAPTIGVDFGAKEVAVPVSDSETTSCKLQVWDTAGQEQFRSITSSYYRGAMGVVLVFDMTRPSSLKSIESYLEEVRNFASPGVVCILVGTKADLVAKKKLSGQVSPSEVVSREEALEIMEKHGMVAYVETSAKKGDGVERVFLESAKQILQSSVLIKDDISPPVTMVRHTSGRSGFNIIGKPVRNSPGKCERC